MLFHGIAIAKMQGLNLANKKLIQIGYNLYPIFLFFLDIVSDMCYYITIVSNKQILRRLSKMKSIDNLVEARTNKTVGNHRVRVTPAGRYFSYHNNVVCKVNDNKKEFSLDDCGWTGKSSTTRTLNCYKRYFTSLGYTEVK